MPFPACGDESIGGADFCLPLHRHEDVAVAVFGEHYHEVAIASFGFCKVVLIVVPCEVVHGFGWVVEDVPGGGDTPADGGGGDR